MLELRLRLNLRYWAKYPDGCRFAGIVASGDEKPVEFGNKQRCPRAGYRRDVGRAAVDVPLRLEHIHVSVAAAEVHALAASHRRRDRRYHHTPPRRQSRCRPARTTRLV